MRSKPLWLIGLLLGAASLGGCYESSDVTVHEPGQYKGMRDPLMQQDPQRRAEILAKRFEMVQTDR